MSQLEFKRVVTRGGDRGESSLFSGERLPKDDLAFMVLGDLDETNACIGLAKHGVPAERRAELETCQDALGEVMALAATGDGSLDARFDIGARLDWLERSLHALMELTELPERFVPPGATEASARLDLARTVCRRAERRLVALIRSRGRSDLAPCQNFVNRLSDYLFVLARHVERLA
jgi:cob(I)alamin adenosyltransferase